MGQAHPQPPASRRQKVRRGRERVGPIAGVVPEVLIRRPQQAQPPASHKRRGRSLLTFALGLGLGYSLATPLPQKLGAALAGLAHGPRSLAAMVDPLGIGNRRILVLGTDVVGGNTDVMFTVQVKDGTTGILQVPRDTYVDAPGLGVMKANALYGTAGVETAKTEVGRLIGSPVDRYLKVNLDALAKLADALGGVNVDVPKRMYYVDNAQGLYIDLQPGPQLLKGKELEGFLRFRHDQMGDLGRMERQRKVINQVFGKLAQPATLARLPELMRIAGKDIHTDLSPIEMTQLLTTLARTRLSTGRLAGRLYWEHDLSYWMPASNSAHPSGSGQEPTP
jgi:LCP family protein required for cell wall assembly